MGETTTILVLGKCSVMCVCVCVCVCVSVCVGFGQSLTETKTKVNITLHYHINMGDIMACNPNAHHTDTTHSYFYFLKF